LFGFHLRTRLRRTSVLGFWSAVEARLIAVSADEVNNYLFAFLWGAPEKPDDHGLHGFAQMMSIVESTETAFHLLIRELRSEVLKNFREKKSSPQIYPPSREATAWQA
jgi:hypothetical protein